MNISDSGAGGGLPAGGGELLGGGLDVAELSRFASKLFRQLDSTSEPAQTLSELPSSTPFGRSVDPLASLPAPSSLVPGISAELPGPTTPSVGTLLNGAQQPNAVALPNGVTLLSGNAFPSNAFPSNAFPNNAFPDAAFPGSAGLPNGSALLNGVSGRSFPQVPANAAAPSADAWKPPFASGVPLASELQPALSGAQYYFLEHAQGRQSGSVERERLAAPALDVPGFGFGALTPLRASVSSAFGDRLRQDFPILGESVNGRRLIWLDNAATTQKPQAVIERLTCFYEHENSNVHRGAHELAARATDAYEGAREKVRDFLKARSTNEIVFTRGATEAINLVAQSWGRANIQKGDAIIVSQLEHHANIVPWQLLAEEKGAELLVMPVDDDGQIVLAEYGKLLSQRTKLVAFTHVSNALGTITPAHEIARMARAVGAAVLVDGAQAVSHMPVDVQSLDADFYVFSGHKVFGPTGIGVLYGKEALLNAMPPWQGGGNMIEDVTFERSRYQKAPARFEAGTGNIADAVGLGAAIDYVTRLGMPAIEAYERALLTYGTQQLQHVQGLRIIGTAAEKAGVLSFVLEGFRTDEVSHALNDYGIAVRGGHHCAQPILRRMGLESTVRPSLALYNTCADLDALVDAILRIQFQKLKSTSARAFTLG